MGRNGAKSYYAFETFILNLLKHHIENQNKTFVSTDNYKAMGDALAPDGFDELSGPTLIEIKYSLSPLSIDKILKSLIININNKFIEHKFSELLIICATDLSDNIKDKINNTIEEYALPFKVIFYGPIELNKIVSKNKKAVNEILNNLFSLRLNSAISKPVRDWKQERSEIVEHLKECYKKGQFSLFLGAGVSSSAGMPDWNTLLNSLFVTYLAKEFDGNTAIEDNDISEIVHRLNGINEPSALMAARYLRKGLSKNNSDSKDFIDAVTKNLYKLRDKNRQIDSELIKSIAHMCLPRRTGAKIRSVVTYNFDDLLERQLHNNNISHRCIYTENENYDPDELPIYHVHGFLPEIRKKYDGLEHSTLVFSEEGYHQIYADAYHWSNLVQLNSFRENNCLMIGLSMTDPNLRRLLDISSKKIEQSKHYAFMQRLSINNFCYKEKQILISNINAAEKFLEGHHALNEELMKELGVTVIWYDSYDEIPQIINAVSRYEN